MKMNSLILFWIVVTDVVNVIHIYKIELETILNVRSAHKGSISNVSIWKIMNFFVLNV